MDLPANSRADARAKVVKEGTRLYLVLAGFSLFGCILAASVAVDGLASPLAFGFWAVVYIVGVLLFRRWPSVLIAAFLFAPQALFLLAVAYGLFVPSAGIPSGSAIGTQVVVFLVSLRLLRAAAQLRKLKE
jgi:hypothetical protein